MAEITYEMAQEVFSAGHQKEFWDFMRARRVAFLALLGNDEKEAVQRYHREVVGPAMDFLYLPLKRAEIDEELGRIERGGTA